MYRALSTGAIGVQVPFEEAVRLAALNSFEGIRVSMADVQKLGVHQVRRLLQDNRLVAAVSGTPVNFQRDDATFDEGMGRLPSFAQTMADLGCTRIIAWILPWHETLSYEDQFERLRARTARICEELARHDLRYGLEFIGPETMRSGKLHPFIHDIDGLLELIEAVGADNLGFLLDSWHWYTSGGTPEDLEKLSDALVVAVHVNDAPRGVRCEDQIDQVRAMPGETGVVDIAAFMGALRGMDYSGPVVAEPFSDWVRALPPEEAVAATARSLTRIWSLGDE